MLNIISTCWDILCVDINVDKGCVDHSTSKHSDKAEISKQYDKAEKSMQNDTAEKMNEDDSKQYDTAESMNEEKSKQNDMDEMSEKNDDSKHKLTCYYTNLLSLTNKRELQVTIDAGGNKIIFSSGARFQLIDFLNVTDLNWAFLNPVK